MTDTPEQVRHIRCKLESAINMLKDGKTIVAYERFLGIKDLLNRLAISLEEGNNENKKDSSS